VLCSCAKSRCNGSTVVQDIKEFFGLIFTFLKDSFGIREKNGLILVEISKPTSENDFLQKIRPKNSFIIKMIL
jgi:hypothetical protein